MSEEIKKMPVDIADEDLDEVAGGASGDGIGGVGVGLRKKPGGGGQVTSTIPVAKPPAAKLSGASGGGVEFASPNRSRLSSTVRCQGRSAMSAPSSAWMLNSTDSTGARSEAPDRQPTREPYGFTGR